MRHRLPLPAALGAQFTVRQAADAGIGRGRVAASDLARPFHGVRALVAPATPRDRVRALAPRLRSGQLIAGATALRLWGYPLPGEWKLADGITVVVPTGSPRVRTAGVTGSRLRAGRAQAWRVHGTPVIDPVAALFMCAAALSEDALVVMIDALITDSDNYPGLLLGRPIADVVDIERRMQEWGRFPGCGRVRAALKRARGHVESPKETEARLLIVAAGLPEPEVQCEVLDGNRIVARSDLAYPRWRVAIEYEGDGHRTSQEQWRRDIQRQRELEDRGWILIRVTQLDLTDGGASLIARLRSAIAARR